METNGKKVIELNIDDVLPNRFQPRIKFNEDAINELSKSIKEHGVIQPIVVRPIGDKFEIIAGERRYKASRIAGKTTIPAIITDLNDKDSAEVALIENVQRENLTPIEEAISYKKILDMGYTTQDALASKLGKTQSTVANKLRLLNLDDEVQEALLNEKISERHARSLLKLTNSNDQILMLNKIINERLTVRRADEEIEKILSGKKEGLTSLPNEEPKAEPEQSNNNTGFKFINTNQIENNDNFNEKSLPQQEEQSEKEEIKPKKFFNILEQEPEKEKEAPETFSFENMFINPSFNQSQNNTIMEEINEIENSIKNSNTIPPITNEEGLESSKEEVTSEEIKEETKVTEENNDNEPEQYDDYEEEIDFLDDIEEPTPQKESRKINNFKDALQEIRTISQEIEDAGFEIETEEYDLDGTYQVVFKIKNND